MRLGIPKNIHWQKLAMIVSILISTSDDLTHLEIEVQEFINMRSRGHLLSPSECLMNIIYSLETAIINVTNNKSISKHILVHD
jgi:hypothetical protein